MTAAIREVKVIPSGSTRYSRGDRSVHLFLLTSQVDDGPMGLLPELFMRQMQIHILGIGPVRSDPGTRWSLLGGVFR